MTRIQFGTICLFLMYTVFSAQCTGLNNDLSLSTNSVDTILKTDKKSIVEVLKANNHLTIEERITIYYRLKKENRNEYDFENEEALNQYGYNLLWGNRVEEAIEIFKLIVKEFPDSFNAYDSLGEAYLKNGNKTLAKENYLKSYALNKDNTYALYQVNLMNGYYDLLVTDSSWNKEIFLFPLSFAPEIQYKGSEDVRFPQGWGYPDSSMFWSYVCTWRIDLDSDMQKDDLETNLELYFDGLMGAVNKDTSVVVPTTDAKFKKENQAADAPIYKGQIKLYDAFRTKKMFTLNATVEQYHCPTQNESIIFFRFSPQPFGTKVWEKLELVELSPNVCEH